MPLGRDFRAILASFDCRHFGAIVCVHLGAGPAGAEKRVAPVIGNSACLNTRALPNPKNDAEAICSAPAVSPRRR
jgi:hypothetical protein